MTKVTNEENSKKSVVTHERKQKVYPWIELWADNAKILSQKTNIIGTYDKDDNLIYRGLYATDIIYPNERVLFIPSNSLIGQDWLRQRAERLILTSNEDITLGYSDFIGDFNRNQQLEETKNEKQRIKMEEKVIIMIERFRQFISRIKQSSTSSDIDNITEGEILSTITYPWRDDDALALFYIACRDILQMIPLPSDGENGSLKLIDGNHDYSNEFIQKGETNHKKISSNYFLEVLSTNAQMMLRSEEGDTVPIIATAIPVPSSCSDNNFNGDLTEENNVNQLPTETSHRDHCNSFLPWIAMLPTDFSTNPFQWESLEAIEGTNTHDFIKMMKSQIKSDYQELKHAFHHYYYNYDFEWIQSQMTCSSCPIDTSEESVGNSSILHHDRCTCLLFRPEILTLELYEYALLNIYSRCTDMWKETNCNNQSELADDCEEETESKIESIRVLAPYLDMLNHSIGGHLIHTMDDDGNISMYNTSTEPILPGSEIYFDYGKFGNEKLLMVYGFTIPNNPYDSVQIYAPLLPTDPLFHVKSKLLFTTCGISDHTQPYCLTKIENSENGSVIPNSLLSSLRLMGIQSADEIMSIASKVSSKEGDPHEIPLISIENEYHALKALGDALDSMARKLALNLVSDGNLNGASIEKVVDTSRPNETASCNTETINAMNAKILCESEYEILISAIEEVNIRLENLKVE